MRPAPRSLLALVALTVAALPADAFAVRRFFHQWTTADGLPVNYATTLAQDGRGFIWVGSDAGLTRFDGDEFRPWAPDELQHGLHWLVGCGGEVFGKATGDDRVFKVTESGIRRLSDGEGEVAGVDSLACDGDGALWIAGAAVRRRSPDGRWAEPFAEHELGPTRIVRPLADGTVAVASTSRLWFLRADGELRLEARVAHARDVLRTGDGRVLVLTHGGSLLELRGDELVERRAWPDLTGRSMWQRGDTLWLVLGGGVHALDLRADLRRKAPPIEMLAIPVTRGLVDSEGSTWLPSTSGLRVYPQPEAFTWTLEEGLLGETVRRVALAGDRVYYSAWAGQGVIDPSGAEAAPLHPDWQGIGPLCRAEATATLWTYAFPRERGSTGPGRAFLAVPEDGPVVVHPVQSRATAPGCAATPGGVLFDLGDGIYLAEDPDRPPRRVAESPLPGGGRRALLSDTAGRLWSSVGRRICSAPGEAALSGESGAWDCADVPGAQVTSLVETGAGGIWAGTRGAGVLRAGDEGWERVPGSRSLASSWVDGLTRSPRGGVWLAGAGVLQRVADQPDRPDGWEVLETLSPRSGHAIDAARHAVESPDGVLWVAGLGGVSTIPLEPDRAAPLPPRVELVAAASGPRSLPLTEPSVLAAGGADLELQVAALTYEDRSTLRYRVRTRPDEPWADAGRGPRLRYPRLAPGDYRFEVVASTDGERWSEAPARFVARVPPPWYLRPAALATFALLALALAWLAYRVRLAAALREERLRTRIAMDLHDEVGSSLGSIVLLAGAAGMEGVDDAQRGDFLKRVGGIAEEVGQSLSDIVWTLRPDSGTVAKLARRVQQTAKRLFPTFGPDALVVDYPDPLPETPVRLATLRAVQLIAGEALHNAAKHARAGRVEVRLRAEGRRWRLTITDDGAGLDAESPRSGGGLGLASMRSRASEIGAELTLTSDDGGTRVDLVFAVP